MKHRCITIISFSLACAICDCQVAFASDNVSDAAIASGTIADANVTASELAIHSEGEDRRVAALCEAARWRGELKVSWGD